MSVGDIVPLFRSAARILWENIQAAMKVEIHNRCSDIELVEPLCFSDGAERCENPDRKVAPGGTLSTAFRVYMFRVTFEGALICRLRKKGIDSDQQSSTDTTSIDEDESEHVQLLVGWKVSRFTEPKVYMLLGWHEKEFKWNEDNLKKQYECFCGRLEMHKSAIKSTWFIEDDIILKLILDGVRNDEYGIKITISEAEQDGSVSLPMPIGPKT
jgi:hypothetical protein